MIEPDVRRERRNFGVRVSMLFAAIFVVAGTNLPYLPVWLDWKGLGAREIAIITATPLFIRVLVTPAIAFAADRAGDHRRFLIVLSWCWSRGADRAVAVVGFLADPDMHRGLRPGLDHDHAADRDRGAERRQSGGARLWPHAPVGFAQLCCRQPRGRLGGGALRGGIGDLAGGGRGRAYDSSRPHACPTDRARPSEGSDQPATPAHVRRLGLAAIRVCFSLFFSPQVRRRPRMPCFTPSARCTGPAKACRRIGSALSGPSVLSPRSRSSSSRLQS